MVRRPKVDLARKRLVDPERGEKLIQYLRIYATSVDAFIIFRSRSIELFKLALNSCSISDEQDLKVGEYADVRFKKLWGINSHDLGLGNIIVTDWGDEIKWQAANKLLRALRYNKLLPMEDHKIIDRELYERAGILYL